MKVKIDRRMVWAGKDQIKAFSLRTSDYRPYYIRGYFRLQTEWYHIKKSRTEGLGQYLRVLIVYLLVPLAVSRPAGQEGPLTDTDRLDRLVTLSSGELH